MLRGWVTFKKVIRHFGLVKYSHSHRYIFDLAFLRVSFVCSSLTNWFKENYPGNLLFCSCWLYPLNSTEAVFVETWPTGWRWNCHLCCIYWDFLTGGSSGFFQLDTCEILAVGSASQMFGLLAVCSEGRIASSLICPARHRFAQNSSLVESWFEN